uniref:Tetraspanin n=1 Tax=Fundulus heteroclitus TaxID=8078 RepID=A0A3Q2QPH9_FUNHE
MGIWVTVDADPIIHLLGPFSSHFLEFIHIGLFCIAMGATLLLLALLGSCGAHTQSKCLLLTVTFILMKQIADAALQTLLHEHIVRAWAIPALQNGYGTDPMVTGIWNTTMTEFQCCGFSNYTDFMGPELEEQNRTGLPSSCCSINMDPCSSIEAARLPVQGCFDPILKNLKEHTNVAGGVAAGVGLLEVKYKHKGSASTCHSIYTHTYTYNSFVC